MTEFTLALGALKFLIHIFCISLVKALLFFNKRIRKSQMIKNELQPIHSFLFEK